MPILSNEAGALKILKSGIFRIDVGGNEVTDYLVCYITDNLTTQQKLLGEKGYMFTTTAERDLVQDIKTSLCYVSQVCVDELFLLTLQDYKRDKSFSEDLFLEGYELPDGQVVRVGYERFEAPEMMFDPTLAGIEAVGIHKLVVQCGSAVPAEKRQQMWQNIILAGGNTCFPGNHNRIHKSNSKGIGTRLQKEITQLLQENDQNATSRVLSYPERPISAWVGTSIMGSLSTMNDLWITKDMYDEIGPSIIHTKCNHLVEEKQ